MGLTYRDVIARLEEAGLGEDAPFEAARLLERFCGVGPETLPLAKRTVFDSPALERAVEARCRRVPLGYVLGQVDFYRETYEVTPDTLIPRPDTEELVEAAIRRLPQGGRILDLCTGSGCVAVSILANRRDARGEAWEWNPGALAVAERNAARNGVADRLTFRLADVLEACSYERVEPCDLLVSNPPYLDASEMASLTPEVAREPAMALDGGADGLTFYRAIAAYGRGVLKPGGAMLFEIGWKQGDALRRLSRDMGYACSVLPDIEERDRVAVLVPVAAGDCTRPETEDGA